MRLIKLCGGFVASQPCGYIHSALGLMARISAESGKTSRDREDHTKSPSEFPSVLLCTPPRMPRCLIQDVEQLGSDLYYRCSPVGVPISSASEPEMQPSPTCSASTRRRVRVIADWPAWCWCSGRWERERHLPEGTHSPLQTTEGASAYARTGSLVAPTVISLRFKSPNPDLE